MIATWPPLFPEALPDVEFQNLSLSACTSEGLLGSCFVAAARDHIYLSMSETGVLPTVHSNVHLKQLLVKDHQLSSVGNLAIVS